MSADTHTKEGQTDLSVKALLPAGGGPATADPAG